MRLSNLAMDPAARQKAESDIGEHSTPRKSAQVGALRSADAATLKVYRGAAGSRDGKCDTIASGRDFGADEVKACGTTRRSGHAAAQPRAG